MIAHLSVASSLTNFRMVKLGFKRQLMFSNIFYLTALTLSDQLNFGTELTLRKDLSYRCYVQQAMPLSHHK